MKLPVGKAKEMWYNSVMNTSLVYLEKDGRYLMLHRTKKKHDINRGKWIGVGGKFLPGESPDECARRETREETGLLCGRMRYRAVVTFVPDNDLCEYMHLFTCSDFSGELQECSEGDLAWIPKEDVLSLPLWEGDRIFLRLLEEDRPFFSLRLAYEGDKLVSARLDGEELPKP